MRRKKTYKKKATRGDELQAASTSSADVYVGAAPEGRQQLIRARNKGHRFDRHEQYVLERVMSFFG